MSIKPVHPNSHREFHVFCDFETNIAYVRIFQYRNYVWRGGKVSEMERDSKKIKNLASVIEKCGIENKQLLIQKDFFLNGKMEKAIVYLVDLKKKEEKVDG